MSNVHERWIVDCAPNALLCRFCRGGSGAIFLEPEARFVEAFHIDCLLASWRRGEAALRSHATVQEELRIAKAVNVQLQTALRRQTPGDIRTVGQRIQQADESRNRALNTVTVPPSPKPAPKAAPKEAEPPKDRFTLIELE